MKYLYLDLEIHLLINILFFTWLKQIFLQLTLEEATALLSEMESSEMEIDCELSELGDIKESASDHENSPSQDLDGIDP